MSVKGINAQVIAKLKNDCNYIALVLAIMTQKARPVARTFLHSDASRCRLPVFPTTLEFLLHTQHAHTHTHTRARTRCPYPPFFKSNSTSFVPRCVEESQVDSINRFPLQRLLVLSFSIGLCVSCLPSLALPSKSSSSCRLSLPALPFDCPSS